MKIFILSLIFSIPLFAQQFVIHIYQSKNSSEKKIVYDPEAIIHSKYNVDPGIIIPDTVRYKIDPEIRLNISTGHSSSEMIIYVLNKNKNSHDELKKPNPDEFLRFSNLVVGSRPPKESGYYILIDKKWRTYNYSQ